MSRTAIRINGLVRDLFRAHGWHDPDNYSLRLSEAIADLQNGGNPILHCVARAIKTTPTKFFQVNRGAKAEVLKELPSTLRDGGIRDRRLIDVLQEFKSFTERTLVSDLAKTKLEAPGRAFLQTYLARIGWTLREVETGRGRMDILLFLDDTREAIETKVWNGPANHEDGLVELQTFMKSERLNHGYYVVFEFFTTEPITGDHEVVSTPIGDIDVVYIHIPLTQASKLGRARRKQGR